MVPTVEPVPPQAPSGLGRNARFGMAPCADVVVRFTVDDERFVGVIVPPDDNGVSKMLGGKCDPTYGVTEDGLISVTMDSTEITALKELMEETGASVIEATITLKDAQQKLLSRVAPPWRAELTALGCTITDNTVTWSQAARDAFEASMKALLRPSIQNTPVPDVRTTQNAGYITTVYDALVGVTQHQLLSLLLTLQGGAEEAKNYGFYPLKNVTMNSTHQQIWAQYLKHITIGIQTKDAGE